jgi:cardiolipin synthase
MHDSTWFTLAVFVADLLIRVGLSVRVVMRRLPVGVSLAWLSVILVLPFVGAVAYLLFGELRLGRRRMRRIHAVYGAYRQWLTELRTAGAVDWVALGSGCEPLARLAEAVAGVAALPGNRLQLLDDADAVFRSLVADIDRAQRTCDLEFYIWNAGGLADEVAAALARAVARGVECRVLLDALGSRPFLGSPHARELRDKGVQVRSALPGGLLHLLFARSDLRLHRKIVVIDGAVAYTGSLNLVDPRFFKQGAGVGQWVDAMVRIEGAAVGALRLVFRADWEVEAGERVPAPPPAAGAPSGPDDTRAAVQVVPSGPAGNVQAVESLLLTAIYSARRELVLTTPYFVPDEQLLTALVSAACRGVDVKLVVPARVDSRMVRLASAAQRGDLASAGVAILEYDAGLLHTKSVTMDGELSLFGSLNLDPRSLHLNFEITLCVYDRDFTARLRRLQQSYVERCTPFDLAAWQKRSVVRRLAEDTGRLLSPLL